MVFKIGDKVTTNIVTGNNIPIDALSRIYIIVDKFGVHNRSSVAYLLEDKDNIRFWKHGIKGLKHVDS
jgi:hypothetical protein